MHCVESFLLLQQLSRVGRVGISPSELSLCDLALHGERIRNLFERDFSRSINLNAQQERASLLRLENSRLFRDNMQNRVVSHTLIDERNVHGSGQLFVDIEELLHQVGAFVLQTDEPVGDLAESLDKVRC